MTEAQIDAPELPDEPRNRGGRLLLIFMATIVIGLGVGFAVRSAFDNAEELREAQTLTEQLQGLPKGSLAGEPASDFSLQLFSGETFTLSRHLSRDGRPVVLNFWYPSCPPCRAEMPALDNVAQATPDVYFLGVGVPVLDTREQAIAFAEEIGVSYPMGWDDDEVISAAFPTFGYPTTVIVDQNGTIVRQFVGIVSAAWLSELLDLDLGVQPVRPVTEAAG